MIALAQQKIGEDAVQTVNARELHTFLEVGKDFSTWIKDRIAQYGFTEGLDFVANLLPNIGEKGTGRPTKEYAISLDMAKELSMVERNDKGKQARMYFLECERRARAAPTGPVLPDFTDPAIAAVAWAEQFKAKQALALENAAQAAQLAIAAPKAAALDRMALSTDGAVCLRIAAKLAQVPERQFIQFMQQEGWITRHHHSRTLMGYQDKEAMGLIELKRTTVTRDDGSDKTVEQVLVTPRGLAKITELVERKAPWLKKITPASQRRRPEGPVQ